MQNSPSIPLFGHNSGVAAWALVSNHLGGTNQAEFDATNFVDGYNLYLGRGTAQFTGALQFVFVTPMPNTKYKVFVNGYQGAQLKTLHVLNTPTYPKTRQSFWVRSGIYMTPGSGFSPAASGPATTHNQIGAITLWSSANSSIGVVVFA